MHTKASRKQTLGVLLIALVLITLCIGGLWVFVKNADAQTGVTEASLAEIPEEYKAVFTQEKYDNYPSLSFMADYYWYQEKALHKEELPRLAELKKAYSQGKRAESKAPRLPGDGPLAIIPLDPKEFAGMTEYYILPQGELTDDQLLMLIGYGEEKGEPFTEDTLTTRNCMRELNTHANRNLSAGESKRMDILKRRVYMEGLATVEGEIFADSLPVKSAGVVRFNHDVLGGYMIYLFPIRELTDEELLKVVSYDYHFFMNGITHIDPAPEKGLDPALDTAKLRSFLEEYMGMPIASENIYLAYEQKNGKDKVIAVASYKTALVGGKDTEYAIVMDKASGNILLAYMMTLKLTHRFNFGMPSDAPLPEVDLNDPRWAEAACKAVPLITESPIISAKAVSMDTRYADEEPGVTVEIRLENGGTCMMNVLIETGLIFYVRYWDGEPNYMADVW